MKRREYRKLFDEFAREANESTMRELGFEFKISRKTRRAFLDACEHSGLSTEQIIKVSREHLAKHIDSAKRAMRHKNH